MLVVTLFALFALRAGPVSRWLSSLCAIAAYLFRTAGIAVLVAWIADSAIRRKWRSLALRLFVAAVPVLGWHAFIARVESDPAYTRPAYEYQRAAYLFNNVSYATNLKLRDPFRPELGTASAPELLWRSVHNLPHLPSALGEVVSGNRSWELALALRRLRRLGGPQAPALAAQIVLVGLGIVTLLGVAILLRRREYLLSLLIIATVVPVCATPWVDHWARYLRPLTPLIVLAAIYGGLALHQRVSWPLARGHEGHAVVALAAALVLVVNLAALAQTRQANHQSVEYEGRNGEWIAYRLYYYRDFFRAFDVGLDWLRQRAGSHDVVATTMPQWVYLRTGLRAVLPPAETDPQEVLRLLDTVPAAYVMAGGDRAIVWPACLRRRPWGARALGALHVARG